MVLTTENAPIGFARASSFAGGPIAAAMSSAQARCTRYALKLCIGSADLNTQLTGFERRSLPRSIRRHKEAGTNEASIAGIR